MGEVTTYSLDYQEVVEAVIKHQGLHEGIWQLHIEFGLGATNMATAPDQVSPVAIVPVKRIGITKVEKEGPLAVDASKVNPGPKTKKK